MRWGQLVTCGRLLIRPSGGISKATGRLPIGRRLPTCPTLLFLFICINASAAPRLFYSKFFKGSVPEYVSITVEHNGDVVYQEAKTDDNPIKLHLSEAEVQELFALADKLDHFQRPVESGLKVANMGTKIFRFEDGAEKHEVEFNYSADVQAQAMWDWFEKIGESERNLINLERAVRYDKLGVNDALLLLQISYDHKRLVAPEQFLPLLDRVAKNESFVHIARERAAGLAETFRKPASPSQEKTQLL
jgi:hypothetical protein